LQLVLAVGEGANVALRAARVEHAEPRLEATARNRTDPGVLVSLRHAVSSPLGKSRKLVVAVREKASLFLAATVCEKGTEPGFEARGQVGICVGIKARLAAWTSA